MTVFIHDHDALNKLERLEGPHWRAAQQGQQDNPYGFYWWARAWAAKCAMNNPDYDEEPVSSFACTTANLSPSAAM